MQAVGTPMVAAYLCFVCFIDWIDWIVNRCTSVVFEDRSVGMVGEVCHLFSFRRKVS